MSKYSSPLFAYNEDDTFVVSLLGTCTCIEHRQRSLLVSTDHQTSGRDLEDIGLLTEHGENFISSQGVRYFSDAALRKTSDAFDICIFDFTDPRRETVGLGQRFFQFSRPPPEISSEHIIAFLISGFPISRQEYQLHAGKQLGLQRVSALAIPYSPTNDEAIIKLEFVNELSFCPDGLSGAPAFVLINQESGPEIYLGGIVQRSNQRFCYIYKSGYLKELLD